MATADRRAAWSREWAIMMLAKVANGVAMKKKIMRGSLAATDVLYSMGPRLAHGPCTILRGPIDDAK